MSYPILWILVEGGDDKRFFESAMVPLLENGWSCKVKLYEYRQKPSVKVNSFIKNIQLMGADYIFLTDLDESSCVTKKKESHRARLSNLDVAKIVVVRKEIESWYCAGLDSGSCKKLGLPNRSTTDGITKEAFERCNKSYASTIAYKLEVLKCFSLPIAKSKNSSLRYFADKYRL
jgi:hypothetical protein